MKTLLETFTLNESSLTELEERIEAGLQTFVDVGNCLLTIRDRRLYKQNGYSRFEDYCRERWNMSRVRAHQLIEGAEVSGLLTTVNAEPPQTERQARELAPLVKADEQEAIETWQQLREEHGDNLTAKVIREAVTQKLKPLQPEQTIEQEPVIDAEVIVAPVEAAPVRPHVVNNSGNNEWYTPSDYIEAARRVMGNIDLDPASSKVANETVKASKYYDIENNGLSFEWQGKVWLNPPYASDLIGKFCDKLVYHYDMGSISEAIVLVNNATETKWFGTLIADAAAVAFPQGRVRFYSPTGEQAFPLQGQAVIYFGENIQQFINEFSEFGWCALL